MTTPKNINISDDKNTSESAMIDIASSSVMLRGVMDEVTLCQCLHCGKLWIPNKPDPNKCPRCHTMLWNKPRLYKIAGAPEPGEKPRARGRAFARGEANPYFQQKRNTESAEADKENEEN